MSTIGFADALSHAGVKYLAASPETMLAPGAPTGAVDAIARNPHDSVAMARGVVDATMDQHYRLGGMPYAPAAAFDVLDLAPTKIAAMEKAVGALDGALADAAADPHLAARIRNDAADVRGMVRFTEAPLPWHADRPAEALYDAFARDTRLPEPVRRDALAAKAAVSDLVIAHRESSGFAPFGGADYSDAAGPTVHFATTQSERDPWAPRISETATGFYDAVGAAKLDRALGTA